MTLNRGLIKMQAKQLIKGKIGKLFLAVFIVSICFSAVSTVSNTFSGGFAGLNDNSYSDFGNYDFGDSYGNGSDFFNFNGQLPALPVRAGAGLAIISSMLGMVASVASFLLTPLNVTLCVFFVWFIRGTEYDAGKGVEIVFKETFNKTYGKKLLVAFLRGIISCGLSLLFIIPGIIFHYSSYFAFELMCDYPELSSWEAIKLSKKMIQGHRGELFALDVSFIGWYILCIFLLPTIYVAPYTRTTKALFYENFRLRALQTGELSEDDFLSEQQKYAKYASGAGINANPFGVQTPNAGSYNQPPQFIPAQSGAYAQTQQIYTPPVQPPTAPPQSGYYQPPIQPQYMPPTAPPPAGYYQPPVQQQPCSPAQPAQPPYVAPVPPVQQPYTPPSFTVSEPVAPQEPSYAEVIVPEESFVEPTEPTAGIDPFAASGEEPKPLSDDGKPIDL